MRKLLEKIRLNIKTILYYRFVLNKIGKHSVIGRMLKLGNGKRITIGDQVSVGKYAWLDAISDESHVGTIRIGNRTQIGNFAHIIALNKIEIGTAVLIADKAFISDLNHRYEDITLPVLDQGLSHSGDITIGDGSWVGENVCILGASVGKHCVIGANAVVTKDIPDDCVAAGNPARILKRYDPELKKWITATDERHFI